MAQRTRFRADPSAAARDGRDHVVTPPVTGFGSALRRTLHLAVPLVGAQLASVAMAATDAAFLGRLGTEALAGGGLAASIHLTCQLVVSGLLTVLAPLAAHAHERRDQAALGAIVRHGVIAALGLGLVAASFLQNVGSVLRALGEPESVIASVDPFARVVAWSMPFLLASTVFRHVLTATGRPRIIAMTSVGAALANGALDAVLVGRMGAAGVGLATTLVSAAACVVLGAAVSRSVATSLVLRPAVESGFFWDLVRLGGPVAVMIGAEVAVFQLAGLVVARLGAAALAAHQVALTVVTVTFVVPLGISQATAVLVAKADARAGPSSVRTVGTAGFALAVVWATGTSATLLIAPEAVARLFVSGNVATAASAVVVLRVAALFQLFDATQVVAAGALRGLRDTKTPAVLGLSAYLIVAPGAAWAIAGWTGADLRAVWSGLAVALGFVAVSLFWRFVRRTRPAA